MILNTPFFQCFQADCGPVDCQAEGLDWFTLEERIKQENPDIVGSGSHSTCNVYKTVRTLDLVKRINPEIITIAGGSHFTMMDEVSLTDYPSIDVIVRYEGEKALVNLLAHYQAQGDTDNGLKDIKGISFMKADEV